MHASSPSPDGICEGQQGYGGGGLGECILDFSSGEFQPLWIAILGVPKVSGDPWNLLEAVGPSWEGETVYCAVDWFTFHGFLDDIQL